MLSEGVYVKSSGTTGPQKHIFRTPENLKACNKIAIESQKISKKSKIYTVCKMEHAGGLLAQTLPAISIGAEVTVEQFNAYRFSKEINKYTHTHLTPSHAKAIIKTKGFKNLNLNGIWITCGSDPVEWYIIELFVGKGAAFMVNWGMSEIGPLTINKVFYNSDQIQEVKRQETILGDTYYCDWKIKDNKLFVKGDTCIYDDWYNTNDLVYLIESYYNNNRMYYDGRLI
jgi:acyl-CoA synthetase (AMP-forming)/AMP-acid ligase II